MSISYIPEETYAVCTYQMGAEPKKFIASRSKVSVFHTDKPLPLLTIEDKNLDEQFKCKAPINWAATFLAVGAGILLVASGPVGWCIAGAALVTGVYFVVKSITHKCTDPMKAGMWMLFHPSVKFDGYNAITHISMLKCDKGGVLMAFFSYALALEAGKQIRNNNWAEVGVNTVISFFAGYFGPAAFSTAFSSLKAFSIFAGTNIVGLGVTWSLQYEQREYMRSDENLQDNSVYQAMNETVDQNALLGSIDDPSDFNDIESLVAFNEAIKSGKVVVDNVNLDADLARLSGMTTGQLKNSPLAEQFFNDVKSGKYGSEAKNAMKNISGKVKPTSSTVSKGRDFAYGKFKSSLKGMGKAAAQGALFFLPFIGTYFSENVRKAFGEAAMKDMANGISVVADHPLQ